MLAWEVASGWSSPAALQEYRRQVMPLAVSGTELNPRFPADSSQTLGVGRLNAGSEFERKRSEQLWDEFDGVFPVGRVVDGRVGFVAVEGNERER